MAAKALETDDTAEKDSTALSDSDRDALIENNAVTDSDIVGLFSNAIESESRGDGIVDANAEDDFEVT